MRKKSLNPGKDGQIWINIGWKLTKSGKRSQPKFCLGESLKDAERRNARIEQLWEDVERIEHDPLWDDLTTEIAKSLGKGELQHVVEQLPSEDHGDYATRINRLALRYPSVKFVPADQDEYDAGQDHLVTFADDTVGSLQEDFGLTVKIGVVSSGTLHQAMDSFIEWIKKDYFDVEEGHINDNGMTKIKQVVALKEYLSDTPLSELGYQAVKMSFSVRFGNAPLVNEPDHHSKLGHARTLHRRTQAILGMAGFLRRVCMAASCQIQSDQTQAERT